ncbi:uncharacterized protein EAF02_006945 [Botrytis sinoallii]|uniref:uncharacterized protein n=1 Tax=Botrytis sinoallii TaxID=1463999 RepID=UPI0019020A3F|nr:uncharacterized protein EAF02_006945 [Botrytis sinoallii]KAF7881054.1 hypothetical protein EAF02_006945 [Botrytis sinoallii]
MASSESAGSGNNGLLRSKRFEMTQCRALDLQKASKEGPEGNEFIQAKLFQYKIIFGKLQLPLRNREDVRDLFEEIFKQHKPQSTSWTSDYYSCIISTDPLYSECSEEQGSAISIGYEQTIQLNDRKQTIKMTSTLYFEGFFAIDSLRSYLRPRRASTQQSSDTSLSRQDGNYLPLEDLRALNLISWDIINSSSFKGGRVGKKFYPHCNPRRIVNRSNTRFIPPQHYVYDVHMGFFTSMLPGPQSILLNVNTTTTAFFPSKMNLQTWLDARWGNSSSYTGVAPRTGKNEIKGVQVTFDLDQVSRKYVISDVHDLCVFKANSGVSPQNDSSKSVWEDMQSCYPGSAHKFSKTASCVNVGNSSHPKLLPADHLRICEWQTVHGELDNLFTAQMLGFAKKTPFENEQEIMNKAFIPLGIKPPVSQIVPWKSLYEFAEALATQLKGHGLQTQSFKGNVPTVAWPKVNEEKKPFKSAAERRKVVNGLLTTCLKRGNMTRLVFVILPDKDAAIYSDIKWWGDCNLGIATICVCPPAVRNKSSGILNNLSLKANFKLGGINHIISDVKEPSELIRSIRNDSLMIFGADVNSRLS